MHVLNLSLIQAKVILCACLRSLARLEVYVLCGLHVTRPGFDALFLKWMLWH